MGIVRHDYQIYFHQKILETCLPKIYEHEWATYESEILNKFNISRVIPERFIVCPRRFGIFSPLRETFENHLTILVR